MPLPAEYWAQLAQQQGLTISPDAFLLAHPLRKTEIAALLDALRRLLNRTVSATQSEIGQARQFLAATGGLH